MFKTHKDITVRSKGWRYQKGNQNS